MNQKSSTFHTAKRWQKLKRQEMTPKSLIYFSFLLIITQSCIPYVKVDNYDKLTNFKEIKEQKNLDKATPTDYIFFFNKMINQRASIFMGNNWEIYHKDSLNVYYGYAVLTKKGIFTDTVYSISKSHLDKEFPLYDSLKFWKIRCKLLDYAYKGFDFGDNHKITFEKDSIYMTSNGIKINTLRKFKSQSNNQIKWRKGEIQFEILVDKLNLEMIDKKVIK